MGSISRADCIWPTPRWLEESRGFLVDMDGTLMTGGQALPGAAALLAALEGRYVIVSNNSTDVATGLARKMRSAGLNVPPERILLAGETALYWLAEHRPRARVLILGSTGLQNQARMVGLQLVDKDPDVVLLARDVDFSYTRLQQVANALRAGAELMVTNPDVSHPGLKEHAVVPETGALMQAVIACAGVQPVMVFGKPESSLLTTGLQRLGISPEKATVIGDNPATDALGAQRLGIPYLLVGKGPQAHAVTPAKLLEYPGPAESETRVAQ